MLRCPNPLCSIKKPGGFTSRGLHHHYRQFRDCEKHFLSLDHHGNQIESAKVDKATDELTLFPALLGNTVHDPESHACYERQDSESVGSLLVNEDDCDDNVHLPEEDDDEFSAPCGEDSSETNDVSYTTDIVQGLPIHKPPNVYDFSADNKTSAADWVAQWAEWSRSLTNDSTEIHPSGLPDDLTLLEMLLEDPNYKTGWNIFSEVEIAEIKMMSRLNRIKGCPLYVYDHVRAWAKECLYKHDDDSAGNHVIAMMRSREQVLSCSSVRANTWAMLPSTDHIKLPGCGKKINITSMSYIGNLYNLLTDQDLVNDKTLLLNGQTPYHNPHLPDDYVIDDFNTGTRYIQAWENKKLSDIDFPLGEVFFVDKSVLDCNDRLSLEPVMHTNSLIHCAARNQCSAWRNLGCLPQFRGLGHLDYEHKLSDYHECLSHILGEYVELQKNKAGLLWPLSFDGKLFMVRFRPYALTVLGDTPGQNQMTGKMTKCNRLCRYCDVEKEDLSDPWFEPEPMTLELQKKIQNSEALRAEYCYKKIEVFWNQVDFGNDPQGIHGNVPGEILHAYMKGVNLRCHECIVVTPSLSASARKTDKRLLKQNEACAYGNQPDYDQNRTFKNPESPTQDELLKIGVFGGMMGKMVNAISIVLGEQLAHQSDRNICRLYFPQGIMTRSKTTASEQEGLTFLMAIILASTWSLQDGGLRDRLGDKRIGAYVKILEHIVCLEELLKMHPGKSPHPILASDLPAISFYTKSLLEFITTEINRSTGDGFNLIKFHLMTHMIEEDIVKYGLPRNVSGSAGESQFKDNFKNPATTTQKRVATFDQQCSERHHEHMTISRCMQILERVEREKSDREHSVVLATHFGFTVGLHDAIVSDENQVQIKELSENVYCVCNTSTSTSSAGPHSNRSPYQVDMVFIGRGDTARAAHFPILDTPNSFLLDIDGRAIGPRGIGGLKEFNPSCTAITAFLQPLFIPNNTLRVSVYTSLKVPRDKYQENDILYRADPFCSIGKKERHDWALVDWGEDGLVPCQVLCFLDIDDELMNLFNLTSVPTIESPGKYAMVYSLKEEIPGLMDPTVTSLEPEHVMQMNSILFFMEKRRQTTMKISSFDWSM